MTRDIAIQWTKLRNNILQELFKLMDTGSLTWHLAITRDSCEYTALYKGKKFQLKYFDTENQYLLIDNKVQDLGKDGLQILCDRVNMQIGLEHIYGQVGDLLALYDFL